MESPPVFVLLEPWNSQVTDSDIQNFQDVFDWRSYQRAFTSSNGVTNDFISNLDSGHIDWNTFYILPFFPQLVETNVIKIWNNLQAEIGQKELCSDIRLLWQVSLKKDLENGSPLQGDCSWVLVI
jgi:hypothetical protein